MNRPSPIKQEIVRQGRVQADVALEAGIGMHQPVAVWARYGRSLALVARRRVGGGPVGGYASCHYFSEKCGAQGEVRDSF